MERIEYKRIKLLVMDVDGVLTDGSIVVHADGSESKHFNVRDGHRIKMWQRAGLQTAILSGRQSAATDHRAEQLGISHVLQDCKFKLPAFEQLLAQVQLQAEEVAYIGDDLMDIPVVKRAGFGVAVADADPQLRAVAQYVTTTPGGKGAVKEVIEHILKRNGKWDELMQRYLT